MGKIITSNQVLSVATGSLPSVLRDALRNNTSKVRWVWCAGDTVAADTFDTLSHINSHAYGILGWMSADPVGTYDALTVTKDGNRYKVGTATTANLAAVAYDDANRTHFPSLQDFCVQCVNNSALVNQIESDIGTDLVAIIMDQVNENVWAVGDAEASLSDVFTQIGIKFEPDDAVATQYGE